ncbi:MAG: site-2 protease family protein [Anaerolineales bacterium]|nr:site-2 protease family protein [Anaerolineales bacterium]HUS85120.1 site-2 protease family protein [Anaerolineales bacterium]
MLGLSLTTLISRVLTLVIAFTVHEFSHALAADQLGDDTPRLQGRLTLNPLVHLDPVGSLMLIIAGFGWARPVQINPYVIQRRTPAGPMIVAFAGPFSNLLLALVATIPIRAGLISVYSSSFLSQFFVEFIWINLILLFFNLLPIFPLDGEKILDYFLPPRGQDLLGQIRPYGMYILMGLIILGSFGSFDLFGLIVGKPAMSIMELLVL